MNFDVDKVKAGLRALIRSTFPRIDYLALYPARVVAQAADGSLDLIPDDTRIGGHQGVPIRYGVPGVRATVAPGARVLLGFAAGDPSKPIAEVWESASVTELDVSGVTIKIGTSSTLAVEKVVLGTTYRTAEDLMLTAVGAALALLTAGPITPPAAAATAAAATAITTFQGAAAAYLSNTVKVSP